MLSVTIQYLGLPTNLTLNLNELYEGGVFKTDAELPCSAEFLKTVTE